MHKQRLLTGRALTPRLVLLTLISGIIIVWMCFAHYSRQVALNRALLMAVGTAQHSVASRLLAQGADANALIEVGQERVDFFERVRTVLCFRGMRRHTTTPLITAAGMIDADSVRILLHAGADPNLRSTDGDLPLLAATRMSGVQSLIIERTTGKSIPTSSLLPIRGVIAELIEHGARVDVCDRDGNIPLRNALCHGLDPSVIELLNQNLHGK